jgi:hypothetical protein
MKNITSRITHHASDFEHLKVKLQKLLYWIFFSLTMPYLSYSQTNGNCGMATLSSGTLTTIKFVKL